MIANTSNSNDVEGNARKHKKKLALIKLMVLIRM